MKKILLTGGTGYIGSHTAVTLIQRGYEVILVDNLVNSKASVVDSIEQITGVRPVFYKIDACNEEKMEEVYESNVIDAIIHFAGLKAVGESEKFPQLYKDVNVGSLIVSLSLMKKYKVKNLVFSSSATVYGIPPHLPLTEKDPIGEVSNPYGLTKVLCEGEIQKFAKNNPGFNFGILRYFNPVGAHPSGLIGEEPDGVPNNLMPYLVRVALGKMPELRVFGDDYDTPDGSPIRDYCHVCDLAEGHEVVLNKLFDNPGTLIYNLASGSGTSVLEFIKIFEKATNYRVPFTIVGRRAGDLPVSYASPAKIKKELGWEVQRTLEDASRDALNFEKNVK